MYNFDVKLKSVRVCAQSYCTLSCCVQLIALGSLLISEQKQEAVYLGETESKWEELGGVEGVRLDILYEKRINKREKKRGKARSR